MTPVIERFLNKISVVDSGCWEWLGSQNNRGYGVFWFNSLPTLSHRFIYEYYHGKIENTLEIDHLCRNRDCCNPEHLEAVTHSTNIMRGDHQNRKVTHCPRGHEYNEENTRHTKVGSRICRKCQSIAQKEFQKNKKLLA